MSPNQSRRPFTRQLPKQATGVRECDRCLNRGIVNGEAHGIHSFARNGVPNLPSSARVGTRSERLAERPAAVWVLESPRHFQKWSYAMTQTDSNVEKATHAATLIPLELLDAAKNKIEALLEVQKELTQTLEGINHELFNRAKKEAELASEFVGKLASVRSVPDATT